MAALLKHARAKHRAAAHHHKKKKKKHKKKHARHHSSRHFQTYTVLPPARPPNPPANPAGGGPAPVFGRDLGHPEIKRLLWRAGYGPRPGDVDALAGRSLDDMVFSLTRPSGAATLVGPEPVTSDGPIAPGDAWGHDHLWWLDRMVRSDQPLVERMTLIFHDWFATSNDVVGRWALMKGQNELFRANALGSFRDLLMGVTQDPAMLVWLNGVDNRKGAPNENYAREVMELFTLGADRGAYTEDDVRQLALCLTGWRADWVGGTGWTNFRYDPNRHDTTTKTVFGQSGNFGWPDAVDLVLHNSYHASFFVAKLWSYFIPTPPDGPTQAALQDLYLSSNFGIRPVVEAILRHPDFYNGGSMVKPPAVYNAGLLRAVGRAIDDDSWVWLGQLAGQQLFYPPNVAGWDDSAWLDTSTWRARWWIANYVLQPSTADPWNGPAYDATENAPTALGKALGALGNPTLTSDTHDTLAAFATSCMPTSMRNWEQSPYRAMRFNALRQLAATCADYQTS